MKKNVIFCGQSSYQDALELQELLSMAGIEAELPDEEIIKNPSKLLRLGRDWAVNVDCFIIVHSQEFCQGLPEAEKFIRVIDTAIGSDSGLFSYIHPYPVFDRWDRVMFNLCKFAPAFRLQELHRLADKIKSM